MVAAVHSSNSKVAGLGVEIVNIDVNNEATIVKAMQVNKNKKIQNINK